MLSNEEKCKCAENPVTKFMKIFSIFYVVVMISTFIYLIIYYIDNEYNINTGKKINKNVQNILIIEKV